MNPGALYQRRALANVAREFFASTAGYVARRIFPIKPVMEPEGKIYELDPYKDILRPRDTALGTRGIPNELYVADPGTLTYSCIDNGLKGFVSDREKIRDGATRREVAEIRKLGFAMRLKEEVNAVAKVDTLSQTSSPGTKWDAAGGTPIADMKSKFKTIADVIGRPPNALMIPVDVLRGITNTTEYKDTIHSVMTPMEVRKQGTAAVLASHLDIPTANVIVAEGYKNTSVEGDMTPTLVPIWDEKALLFYMEENPDTIGTQALGFTFEWNRGASSDADGFRVEQRRATDGREGDEYFVRNSIDQKLLTAGAGYLWTNTLT